MKKQDVLNRVLNSESSIFAKDDVVRLIEAIDEARKISVTDITSVLDEAMDELSRRGDDLLETSTAEFDLNGNEIQLLSVDVDLSYIRDVLEDYLMPLGEVDSKE
jgi:cell division ATPase FtsA